MKRYVISIIACLIAIGWLLVNSNVVFAKRTCFVDSNGTVWKVLSKHGCGNCSSDTMKITNGDTTLELAPWKTAVENMDLTKTYMIKPVQREYLWLSVIATGILIMLTVSMFIYIDECNRYRKRIWSLLQSDDYNEKYYESVSGCKYQLRIYRYSDKNDVNVCLRYGGDTHSRNYDMKWLKTARKDLLEGRMR